MKENKRPVRAQRPPVPEASTDNAFSEAEAREVERKNSGKQRLAETNDPLA